MAVGLISIAAYFGIKSMILEPDCGDGHHLVRERYLGRQNTFVFLLGTIGRCFTLRVCKRSDGGRDGWGSAHAFWQRYRPAYPPDAGGSVRLHRYLLDLPLIGVLAAQERRTARVGAFSRVAHGLRKTVLRQYRDSGQ
jgi:hypothetical protein